MTIHMFNWPVLDVLWPYKCLIDTFNPLYLDIVAQCMFTQSLPQLLLGLVCDKLSYMTVFNVICISDRLWLSLQAYKDTTASFVLNDML